RGVDRHGLHRVQPRGKEDPLLPPDHRQRRLRPRKLRGGLPLRSVGESTMFILLTALLSVCAQDAGDRVLFDFEKPEDAERWSNLQILDPSTADRRIQKEPNVTWSLSKDNATSGAHSLKITFDEGRWPTITTALPREDWMGFHRLCAD